MKNLHPNNFCFVTKNKKTIRHVSEKFLAPSSAEYITGTFLKIFHGDIFTTQKQRHKKQYHFSPRRSAGVATPRGCTALGRGVGGGEGRIHTHTQRKVHANVASILKFEQPTL